MKTNTTTTMTRKTVKLLCNDRMVVEDWTVTLIIVGASFLFFLNDGWISMERADCITCVTSCRYIFCMHTNYCFLLRDVTDRYLQYQYLHNHCSRLRVLLSSTVVLCPIDMYEDMDERQSYQVAYPCNRSVRFIL